MKNVPPEERVKRVRDVAEMVRIGHLLDKMPGQCSDQRKRFIAIFSGLIRLSIVFFSEHLVEHSGQK